MAHLDLEEQEQLDQLKHFWKRWGNLVTWAVIAALAAYSGWNGWLWWQQRQANQAATQFDAVDKALRSGDVNLLDKAMQDMREQYGSTLLAQQAALLSAKFFEGQGKTDQARSLLKWVHQHGSEPGLAAAAGLRLAGSYIQTQEIGEAQQLLGSSFPPAFQPLVHERLADVAMLQKQSDKAKELYLKAWKAMPQQSEYRRLVEVKLAALGVEHPLEGDKP